MKPGEVLGIDRAKSTKVFSRTEDLTNRNVLVT